MKYRKLFWIFAVLKYTLLGTILFLIFHCMNALHGSRIIGLDTQLFLCLAFPLFSLLVKYVSLRDTKA